MTVMQWLEKGYQERDDWRGGNLGDWGASSGRMQSALDESLVFRAGPASVADPVQGAVIANQISDPTLRTLALVLLAPYEKDKQQARRWVLSAEQALSALPDSLRKLQLMTAIIKSELRMDDAETARKMLPSTFALGERIYHGDHEHPEKPAYAMAGAAVGTSSGAVKGGTPTDPTLFDTTRKPVYSSTAHTRSVMVWKW